MILGGSDRVRRGRKRGTSMVAAGLVLGLLAGLLSVVSAPVATAAEGTRYRIVDGAITYSGGATLNCTFDAGSCHDYDGGYRLASMSESRSTDLALSVHSAGEPEATSGPAVQLSAPLTIDSWKHVYTNKRIYSATPCGSSVTWNEADSDLTLADGNPSFFNIAMTLTPGTGNAFSLELVDREGTEPRFGWMYPIGMRWYDSSLYPTMTLTSTGTGDPLCAPSSTTELSVINRSPFDAYSGVDRSRNDATTTYDSAKCNGDVCTVRVHGTARWSYSDSSLDGNDLSGGFEIPWWVDVAVVQNVDARPCDDGQDNDGDGAIDYPDDPGCNSADDPNELGKAQCDNGLDDDNDLAIDYRAVGGGDPGCESLTDDSEIDEPCADASGADRHFTTLAAKAKLKMFASPDPWLGTVHLSFGWCMTPQGPQIMTRPESTSDPFGWWDQTTNWKLLGSLESFAGIDVKRPAAPSVTHGSVSATVTTSLVAGYDATAIILSAIPESKLFKPLASVLKKAGAKLNPLAKKLRAATADAAKTVKEITSLASRITSSQVKLADVQAEIARLTQELQSPDLSSALRGVYEHQLAKAKSVEKSLTKLIKKLEKQQAIAVALKEEIDQTIEAAKQKLDQILTALRAKLEAANDLVERLSKAIDKKVAKIKPGWVRELVQNTLDLSAAVRDGVDSVVQAVEGLVIDKVDAIVASKKPSSKILSTLKSAWKTTIKSITDIDLPVWDADLTVSLDPDGHASVADNSTSHLIFTVYTEQTLKTT